MNDFKIIKWEPVSDIPPQLYLEGLHDDFEGFRLFLKGKSTTDRLLKIEFVSHLGYRNIDETNRIKTLNEQPILTIQWPLYISSNGDPFIDWVIKESSGLIYDPCNYINYIICTPSDIVEVISNETPIVEWL